MLYLICQNDVDIQKLSKKCSYFQIKDWVYIGEDSTWRVRAESHFRAGLTRISIADLLDDSAQELRQPYIDWIGEISRTNTSFEWWSSEVAAKNPYTFFFVRLCLLKVVQKLIRKGLKNNTLIICSTPALFNAIIDIAGNQKIAIHPFKNRTIRGFFRRIGQTGTRKLVRIVRSLPPVPTIGKIIPAYNRFLETDVRYRSAILSRYNLQLPVSFSDKKTVIIFTWIDRRSFPGNNTYSDAYFGPLPQILKKMGYYVIFVPRVLPTIPFEEAVQQMVKSNEAFIFPEFFITKLDYHVARKRQKSFDPTIPTTNLFGEIQVSSLVHEHISQTRETLLDNLLFEPLIQSMRDQGIHPERIIHTCEGHSWEQALSWSVHNYLPGTIVVGYDNVTFSRMVLSMYPAISEWGFRPLPDRIVTNGPLFRDTLLKEGFPSEKIRVGCALRHTYLWKNVPDEVHPKEISNPVNILVATAIGLGDSVELVSKACEAFSENLDYHVIIKCHPLVNPDEVKKYVGNKANSPNIIFEKSSIMDLLPSAHILLYTYTSVCYEAMMYGVIPICVKAENFLNLDKLDANPDIRWMVTTPAELQEAVKEIISMDLDNRKTWCKNAKKIVKSALAPLNEKCIRAFLE
jgi:hypothetical protein